MEKIRRERVGWVEMITLTLGFGCGVVVLSPRQYQTRNELNLIRDVTVCALADTISATAGSLSRYLAISGCTVVHVLGVPAIYSYLLYTRVVWE